MDVTEETRNPKISQAAYVGTKVSPTRIGHFQRFINLV